MEKLKAMSFGVLAFQSKSETKLGANKYRNRTNKGRVNPRITAASRRVLCLFLLRTSFETLLDKLTANPRRETGSRKPINLFSKENR